MSNQSDKSNTTRPEESAQPACLVAALSYLEMGLAPIPLCSRTHTNVSDSHKKVCRNPGKMPLRKDWQKRRLTREELEAAWAECPEANVGVVMGLSNLIGIDVDNAEGERLLHEWAGAAANIPPTWKFNTPNGGFRLLFALSKPLADLAARSFRTGDRKEAIRILAGNSQTVMPPSRLASGDEFYEWMGGCEP
jgi:hypothetical protein